jgi:hypothetical protein
VSEQDGRKSSANWWLGSAAAIGRRPDLWWVALVELRAFTGRRWWRHWPPLPLPDKQWVGFRMETAYGDPRARPLPEDTIAWLSWCRDERAPRRQAP